MKAILIWLVFCFVLPLSGGLAAAAPADPEATDAYLILGYAGAQSVPQGGSIDLHISTAAPTYELVVNRWGANGLEQKQRISGLPGAWYGDCGTKLALGVRLAGSLHLEYPV